MIWEYLIFNAVIFIGPLIFSFDRKVRYVRFWRFSLLTALIVSIPWLTWDSLVTHRHWWFHTERALPVRIMGLPPGEWLFFWTVPFACLFIWEIFRVKHGDDKNTALCGLYRVWPLLMGLGVILFLTGKEYTGLTAVALGLSVLLDYALNTRILMQRDFIVYIGIVTGLMLVFNGYLTARPLVLYDPQYQLDFRIITIPIEDFFYGYGLIIMNTMVYEKLRGRA